MLIPGIGKSRARNQRQQLKLFEVKQGKFRTSYKKRSGAMRISIARGSYSSAVKKTRVRREVDTRYSQIARQEPTPTAKTLRSQTRQISNFTYEMIWGYANIDCQRLIFVSDEANT